MRIRFPFASTSLGHSARSALCDLRLTDVPVGFLILLLFSSSLGLLPSSALPSTPDAARPYIPPQSDKALHFLCFFFLTAVFYFIFDTARRRVIHLTLIICTLLLGVGSEVVQGLLPNDRDFDAWDVLANVIGSLAALGLASAYHRRAAERRRLAKYSALTGDGLEGEDLELGEGANGTLGTRSGGEDEQETGVVPARTVEEELDNWDENAQDDQWDDDDDTTATTQNTKPTPSASSVASEEPPKKVAMD